VIYSLSRVKNIGVYGNKNVKKINHKKNPIFFYKIFYHTLHINIFRTLQLFFSYPNTGFFNFITELNTEGMIIMVLFITVEYWKPKVATSLNHCCILLNIKESLREIDFRFFFFSFFIDSSRRGFFWCLCFCD